jgi:hypothetical protein
MTRLEENVYQKAVQFKDIIFTWKISKCYEEYKWNELNCYKVCHCEMYFDYRLETAHENFSPVHSSIKILPFQS